MYFAGTKQKVCRNGKDVWDVDIRYDNHVNYNKCSFRTDTSDEVTKKGRLSRASTAVS
jgi:hypothetical protein